jgi:gliding motility-associated-like protein
MKKILLTLLVLCFITQHIFSQCTVTETAPRDTIVCGERVSLTAFGRGQGNALLSENFNNGTYGPGWQSTQQAMWNNPCGTGPDGTTHIWMGNSSPVPRILTTASFNLSSCVNAGVTICFDMKFATQGDNTPCEGPDEPNEGVYLQYSIDNGATWQDIHYFDPNGGYDPQFINWNNWCFPVPAVALTANTKFRWFQDADSGADYDHWGLDNVVIYCNDPTFAIVWQHDGYSAGPVGGTNPTPVAPHTTTSYPVVMSNGTTTCRDTVTIVVVNPTIVVNAGNDTVVCTGQCARLNATAKIIQRPAKTPTYQNQEQATISGSPGFPGFPPFIPATPGTAFLNMDINVTNLNLNTVTNNYITSVCIGSLNMIAFAGIEIFDIWLVCPSGDSILLVKDSTLTGNTLTNTCFVPGGSNIASGTSPYSGSYAPNQSFNNLAGCDANGVWSLHFVAVYSGFTLPTGTFSSWSISFNDPEISYTGNFTWSPTNNMSGSTTLTPTVCPPPTAYTLTVSDTAGCVTQSDVVNVTTQACCSLSATATRTQPTCGQSNGSINITPVPAGSYTYAWSDGSITTQNRTGLAAGTYTVTITSTVTPTCTFDTTIILNSNSSLAFNFTNQQNPTCAGAGNNGSITANLAGGTAPYTISVDTNGTPQTSVSPIAGSLPITGLHGGTITVSVTDAAGCTASATATLITPNCCSLSASSTNTQPTCGQSNGTINITPAPVGNYTYAWSDGPATTQNRTGLAAGSYTVTITTVGNATCTATTSVTLNSNSTLTFNFTNQQNPTCAGAGNNGSITANLAGGTAPYTISVDTNGTPQTSVSPVAGSLPITGLHGGTITVSITDAAGCTASASATLTTPVCCSLSATAATTQPTCGASNGAINITPLPAGNYTYAWSDGPATTQNRTAIAAGTYTVTITTVGNTTCTFDTTIVLNSNSTLNLAFSNQQNPTCAGLGNDGSIVATLAGGTAPYTISIDTNGTPTTLVSPVPGQVTVPNLHAGVINVSVTDAAGCTASASATIIAPANCCTFTVSAAITQPTCGQSDGGIALTSANGSGNYSYSWAPGAQTTAAISSQPAGNYLVTITDNAFANCFIDTTFALTNPNAPIIDSFKIQDVTCNGGGADGSVSVYASSPNGIDVTTGFTWSNTNTDHDDTQSGLAAGNYLFTVTDLVGCSTPGNVSIGTQAGCCFLQIAAAVQPPSCGLNNGQITASVTTAGVPPYTYSIDGINYQNTAIFTGLAGGNYNVYAADANLCRDTVAVVVPASVNTLLLALAATDVTCFGANDGTANVTPNGGNAPFTYVWNTNPAATTNALTSLAPGNYAVTVTDNTSCTGSGAIAVAEPSQLTIDLGNDTTVCEGTAITLSAPAGYTDYLWSSNETTPAISITASGVYTITVTSATGCTASDAVNVTLVPIPTVNLGEDKLVYEGENIGINGIVNEGTVTGGNYNWMPDTLLNCANCPNVVAYAADTITYTLIFTDDYGCSAQDAITLNVLPVGDIFWPNAFTPNGDGNNDIFIPAGSGVRQIQWQMFNRWGEKVFESNNFFYGCDGTYQGKPLPAGVYVYVAKVVLMNNRDRKYKGSVTLIR